MPGHSPNVTSTILATLRFLQAEIAAGRRAGEISGDQVREALAAVEREQQNALPMMICIEGGSVVKVYSQREEYIVVADLDQHWHEKAVPVPLDDGVPPMALVFAAEVDAIAPQMERLLRGELPVMEPDTQTASLTF